MWITWFHVKRVIGRRGARPFTCNRNGTPTPPPQLSPTRQWYCDLGHREVPLPLVDYR